MKYQILTVGLKGDLFSHCREHFLKRSAESKNVLNISEAVRILEKETIHLLVLDMEYLRSIGQSDWIINIRYISFIPIVVLSDIPETDVGPTIKAGADVCYDNKLPPSMIVLLLSAMLRRYTEYNHLRGPETAPFQVGDIAIDPCRHLVWVCGREVTLRPREFNLLLYLMQNPNIVLTAEQICEHAWGVAGNYNQGISHPIYLLRKSIEPNPAHPIYIKTMYRVGYYFSTHTVETCDICENSVSAV